MRTRVASSFGDFRCAHCHVLVSSAHLLSGVNNRNHCPYCLWSFHLDLFAAGDRLSACKAPMKPIGLTMKRGKNKYQPDRRGELMVVHQCTDCGALSINRIAADDDSEKVMAVFEGSMEPGPHVQGLCQENGILILGTQDTTVVKTQLYGHAAEVPAPCWR